MPRQTLPAGESCRRRSAGLAVADRQDLPSLTGADLPAGRTRSRFVNRNRRTNMKANLFCLLLMAAAAGCGQSATTEPQSAVEHLAESPVSAAEVDSLEPAQYL